MRQPLPDPEWVAPEFCVRCGYSLLGHTAPGRCPECAAPFLERHLVLHGVPSSAKGTSPARRVAWAGLILATVACSQFAPFLFISSWMLGVLALGTIIAG